MGVADVEDALVFAVDDVINQAAVAADYRRPHASRISFQILRTDRGQGGTAAHARTPACYTSAKARPSLFTSQERGDPAQQGFLVAEASAILADRTARIAAAHEQQPRRLGPFAEHRQRAVGQLRRPFGAHLERPGRLGDQESQNFAVALRRLQSCDAFRSLDSSWKRARVAGGDRPADLPDACSLVGVLHDSRTSCRVECNVTDAANRPLIYIFYDADADFPGSQSPTRWM